MQNNYNKKPLKIALVMIVAAAVACLYVINHLNSTSTADWKTYTQKEFGIQLKYPPGWEIVDNLTPKSCCLFVIKYHIATTTTMNASGTPMTTVTGTESIKLQIGPYDTKSYDPFKVATTTKVHLGKNDFYSGTSNGIPFYILPASPTNGFGVAEFTYAETPDSMKVLAKQVISTITLVPPVVSTTTATSTKK